jgi:hypothetical protein
MLKNETALYAIVILAISILSMIRLGPGIGLDMDTFWPYLSVGAIAFVAGFIVAIKMLHYKEAGAVNKTLTHVAGNFATVAKSDLATSRMNMNSINQRYKELNTKERDLNSRTRELDKREAKLQGAEIELKQMVEEKLREARSSRRKRNV